jgi:16S rRNA (cytidine1402-2'-O)-methyltransferase
MPGTLFVVATPIGNLEDISARALRILGTVSLVAAEDTRRTAQLLARHAITTATTSLHEHNEREKVSGLLARLQRGEDIALVSDAGTPTLSDPGSGLVRAALDEGLRVEPIPGPSAVLAALSVSGIAGNAFTFLGFPPTRSSDRNRWFEDLKSAGRTVVFFEAPHRILETLERIHRELGSVRVCIGREITKAHEEFVIRPIDEAIERLGPPRGEYTVVVEIGHITNIEPINVPAGADLVRELGLITENGGSTRKQAISVLARRYGKTPNEIYKSIESAKKLVK